MDRTPRYARCGEPTRSCTLSKTKASFARPKSKRQGNSGAGWCDKYPVRFGGGLGEKAVKMDLARSLSCFKVVGVLFLGEVSSVFLPSLKACWTHTFRYLGVGQQYPSLICDFSGINVCIFGKGEKTRVKRSHVEAKGVFDM